MSFAAFKRRAGSGSAGPARIRIVREDERQPVIIQQEHSAVSIGHWLADNAPEIEAALDAAGAVLLRGFFVDTPQRLESVVRTLYGEPMSYRENTSQRTALRGQIKTSTDHPADQAIELHNEQSYSRVFPLRLLFACARPADSGGETPIADTRRILGRIDHGISARFARDGYLYRCAFLPGFRPSWQETYQFDARDALERYLPWAGIRWTWDTAGVLRTELRRSAVMRHPRTQEAAWCNHILFWHHSSLEPEVAAEMLRDAGEAGLPHAVFHGDGATISAEEIEQIRGAYRAETWPLRWQAGDLLILDNVLRAHGRAPYDGSRAVLFAMASPFDAAGSETWMT